MPRFTDPDALLHDLLDKHEKGGASPFAHPDRTAFSSIVEEDRFDRVVRAAEALGCVSVKYGKGAHRREIALVRLVDAEALHAHLERVPASALAVDARAQVLEGLDIHPGILATADEAFAAWGRNTSWWGLSAGSVAEMRNAVILAQRFVDGRHVGLDYRTFSRKSVGDSKALENLENPVLRLLSKVVDLPPSGKPRAVFASLGLERISQPLLVSGPVSFVAGGDDLPVGYVGVPCQDVDRLHLLRRPEYVLTIENMVSFVRHVLEADPARNGLTVYVGGYPSLGVQKALSHLGSVVPSDVPFFHWSDIDLDGTWIYRTVETAAGRSFSPHLMNVALVEELGRPPKVAARHTGAVDPASPISDLVAYLARPDAKTLEQEDVDPATPVGRREGPARNGA